MKIDRITIKLARVAETSSIEVSVKMPLLPSLEKLMLKSENEFLIYREYIKRNFDNLLDCLQLTYHSPIYRINSYYFLFISKRLYRIRLRSIHGFDTHSK